MISRGGFGEVWSGIYQNRPVAIKRLLPDKKTFDDAMAFAAEIKVMARLNHPKIVEFIGASWSNALSIQAISEYMNCGDLKSLLERSMKSGTVLPWLNVKLNLAVDITDALVYLHTLNPKYIHRDLKSRNILIDADNGAKLSDFGISRNRAADETMTAGVGTCRWMAPEVIRGEKYDESCDVWSFGCVLSEMDSGMWLWVNDALNDDKEMCHTMTLPTPTAVVSKTMASWNKFRKDFSSQALLATFRKKFWMWRWDVWNSIHRVAQRQCKYLSYSVNSAIWWK
ncbi:hypothetical protein AC1031_007094 [Aphanomyces cochlioides]|nr:hypothetical protein AC1031_007094 [Aphanomyces cochlioides]